jgi:hypothetical protein
MYFYTQRIKIIIKISLAPTSSCPEKVVNLQQLLLIIFIQITVKNWLDRVQSLGYNAGE